MPFYALERKNRIIIRKLADERDRDGLDPELEIVDWPEDVDLSDGLRRKIGDDGIVAATRDEIEEAGLSRQERSAARQLVRVSYQAYTADRTVANREALFEAIVNFIDI